MTIYKFKTTNPARVLTISATDRADADTKFNQMRDSAGLTEESQITEVLEIAPLQNIVEHAELQSQEEAKASNTETNKE